MKRSMCWPLRRYRVRERQEGISDDSTGFAVYMGKNQGFVRFADLVEPPQYNEGVVNSGIILKTADKVVDLYARARRGRSSCASWHPCFITSAT